MGLVGRQKPRRLHAAARVCPPLTLDVIYAAFDGLDRSEASDRLPAGDQLLVFQAEGTKLKPGFGLVFCLRNQAATWLSFVMQIRSVCIVFDRSRKLRYAEKMRTFNKRKEF